MGAEELAAAMNHHAGFMQALKGVEDLAAPAVVGVVAAGADQDAHGLFSFTGLMLVSPGSGSLR